MWLPHKTVATVVEHEGHFLMVQERTEEGLVYNQPAGHLEPGESLVEAARRETLEETSWDVAIDSFLGLYHYTSPANNICYIRSCFIATPLQQYVERELDPEIVQVHWLAIEEIRELNQQLRSPVVLKVLEDYLNGIKYPLSLISTF